MATRPVTKRAVPSLPQPEKREKKKERKACWPTQNVASISWTYRANVRALITLETCLRSEKKRDKKEEALRFSLEQSTDVENLEVFCAVMML